MKFTKVAITAVVRHAESLSPDTVKDFAVESLERGIATFPENDGSLLVVGSSGETGETTDTFPAP